MTTAITRDNIEALLDAGKIEVSVGGGKWTTIKRAGPTSTTGAIEFIVYFAGGRWDRDVITDGDFINGSLLPELWRIAS